MMEKKQLVSLLLDIGLQITDDKVDRSELVYAATTLKTATAGIVSDLIDAAKISDNDVTISRDWTPWTNDMAAVFHTSLMLNNEVHSRKRFLLYFRLEGTLNSRYKVLFDAHMIPLPQHLFTTPLTGRVAGSPNSAEARAAAERLVARIWGELGKTFHR